MKKFLIGAACLAVAGAPIAASAAPFGGRGHDYVQTRGDGFRGGRGFDRDHFDRDGGRGGAALAAGLFGLVLGAAIASNHDYDYGYQPYETRCWWQSEPVRGPYGYVHYEQVQVCR
ncbi:MAG TPA: hypothetical protein VMT68_21065 [Caulobacteraceae bacterium]|nr:hypothetical protein [Caulobacteraceae bacterium]